MKKNVILNLVILMALCLAPAFARAGDLGSKICSDQIFFEETDGRGYSGIDTKKPSFLVIFDVNPDTLCLQTIHTKVESTGTSINIDSFFSEPFDTHDALILDAFFAIDSVDSNFPADTAIFVIKTAKFRGSPSLTKTILTDTIVIGSDIKFYLFDDDTLFWPVTWAELYISDSTSDSANADALHKYQVAFGVNKKTTR